MDWISWLLGPPPAAPKGPIQPIQKQPQQAVTPPVHASLTPPPLPHPDRLFVLGEFNAFKASRPGTTWTDFLQGLEGRHKVAREEVAKRKTKLAQLTAQGTFRP